MNEKERFNITKELVDIDSAIEELTAKITKCCKERVTLQNKYNYLQGRLTTEKLDEEIKIQNS